MRIFDTFPFDGELDLLDHHLRETIDLVDGIVLVEARQTYRGSAKPLTFDAHAARFGWAAAKLRHVKLAGLGAVDASPRARAAVQRNAVLLALDNLAPDDIVLLLDVDEVPSRALLARLRRDGLVTPRRLAMTRHYGFADRLAPRSPCCPTRADPFPQATRWHEPAGWADLAPDWYGQSGVAVTGAALRQRSPSDWRYAPASGEPIADAGRHFSSVDPSTRLARKLLRVFHAEFADARATRPDNLERCHAYGVHHRGWWYAERPRGALPDDVQRLVDLVPQTASPPPATPFRRRTLRNWAWLRLMKWISEGVVAAVDRRFELLLPVIAIPLLLCDAGRAAAGALTRCLGLHLARPDVHHHSAS